MGRGGVVVQIATWGSVPGFCFFLIEIFTEVSIDRQAVGGNNTEIPFGEETSPSLPEWNHSSGTIL